MNAVALYVIVAIPLLSVTAWAFVTDARWERRRRRARDGELLSEKGPRRVHR